MQDTWTTAHVAILTKHKETLDAIDADWEENGKLERALQDRLSKDMVTISRESNASAHQHLRVTDSQRGQLLEVGSLRLSGLVAPEHRAAFKALYSDMLDVTLNEVNKVRELGRGMKVLSAYAQRFVEKYPGNTNYARAAEYLENALESLGVGQSLGVLRRDISEEQRIAMVTLEDEIFKPARLGNLDANAEQRAAIKCWRNEVAEPPISAVRPHAAFGVSVYGLPVSTAVGSGEHLAALEQTGRILPGKGAISPERVAASKAAAGAAISL